MERFRAVIVGLVSETLFGVFWPKAMARSRRRKRAWKSIARRIAIDNFFWYATVGHRRTKVTNHGYGGPDVLRTVSDSFERTVAQGTARIRFLPSYGSFAPWMTPRPLFELIGGVRPETDTPMGAGTIDFLRRISSYEFHPRDQRIAAPGLVLGRRRTRLGANVGGEDAWQVERDTANVLDQDDPFWLLELVAAADAATLEGLDDFAGGLCRRYLLTVNFDTAASKSSYVLRRPKEDFLQSLDQMMLELWIDNGLIRGVTAHRARSETSLCFVDYGTAEPIEFPAESELAELRRKSPRRSARGGFIRFPLLAVAVAILASLTLSLPAGSEASAHSPTDARGQRLPGTDCPAFPADNVWNTPITGLPVNSHSSAWLAHMDAASTYLHPDYGPAGGGARPYGIPWQITSPHVKFVHIDFGYAGQSDRGPYPFTAATPIEGGSNGTGDRHALMVDPKSCKLYELYDAHYREDNRSTAGSGAIWSLRSNRLRPAGWTSADAAGLPILPGLVNYDEVMSGHLDHAIRFTAQTTSVRYLWPARHEAGSTADSGYPPMGARFRLSAGFSLRRARCARPCQVVIRAMKTYGLILADNGSSWFFQGTADRRWTDTMVDQLKQIPAAAFPGRR